MNDMIAIWEKRFADFVQERTSYLKWVANGGLLFALILLISYSALYYERFLLWLPESLPVIALLSLFFAWLLTRGRIRTLVRQADLVYLTAGGVRMNAYFQKALLYNWVMQSLALLAGFIAVYPLMVWQASRYPVPMLLLLLILLLLKGGNLAVAWQSVRLHARNERAILYLVRFVTNFLLVYIMLHGANTLHIVSTLTAVALLINRYMVLRKQPYNWLNIIAGEEKLDTRFFRFINNFVDVPHLEMKLYRLPLLPAVTGWLPFTPRHAHYYLYIKLFLRGEAISGMILRLTIAGALLILLTPDFYWQLAIALLLLFLSGMQLRSFWPAYHNRFWTRVLPLPEEIKQRAFITLTFAIMIAQTVVVTAAVFVAGSSPAAALLLLLVGLTGAYVFCFAWLKRYISAILEKEMPSPSAVTK